MLPIKNINAIKLVHKIFSENQIPWRLAGSSNLVLQDVFVEAHDVDITVNTADVEKIQKLFNDYTLESIQFSQTEKFRSYFGRYTLENCLVEVMSDLEIFKDTIWLKAPSAHDIGTYAKLGNLIIPCISLECEYEGCIMLGRLDKAEKIKQALSRIK